MTEIKIKIKKDGRLEADFVGFHGSDCDIKEYQLMQLLDELDFEKTAETKKQVEDRMMELEKA